MPFFSCYPRSCVRTGDSPNPGGHNGQTTPQQRSLLAFAALSGTAPIWCHRLIGPWCCRATRARRTCRMVMLDAHSPSSIGPAMRERKAAYSSLESLLRRLFVPPLRPAACASSEDHVCARPHACAQCPPREAISRRWSGDMLANPRGVFFGCSASCSFVSMFDPHFDLELLDDHHHQ